MDELRVRPRRQPLGAVPVARWGVSAAAAGFETDFTDDDAAQLRIVDPTADENLLTRVATDRTLLFGEDDWGIRVDYYSPDLRRRRREPAGEAPIGSGDESDSGLSSAPLARLRLPKRYLAIPKSFPASRDYLAVTTYDADVLPLDSLLVIPDDSVATFGMLSSRAFFVWTHVVSRSAKKAVTLNAYNTFPFPTLNKKQALAIETAADTVLRARMHFLQNSLYDLYASMPRPLLDAHRALDGVVESLLGISEGTTDRGVALALYERYQELLAA